MKLALIAAIGDGGAIGYKGQMPWKCSNDLKHFKQVTSADDAALVMGRRTWDSLPEPKLPGRVCVVLTSQSITGRCLSASNFDDAIKMIEGLGLKKTFIIGGSLLFNEYYEKCDELYLTYIEAPIENADTFFNPIIKPQVWRAIESTIHTDCQITRWVKR